MGGGNLHLKAAERMRSLGYQGLGEGLCAHPTPNPRRPSRLFLHLHELSRSRREGTEERWAVGKCVSGGGVGVRELYVYPEGIARSVCERENLLLFHWWFGGGPLFCKKISPPEGEGHSGPLSLKSKDPLPPPGHVIH